MRKCALCRLALCHQNLHFLTLFLSGDLCPQEVVKSKHRDFALFPVSSVPQTRPTSFDTERAPAPVWVVVDTMLLILLFSWLSRVSQYPSLRSLFLFYRHTFFNFPKSPISFFIYSFLDELKISLVKELIIVTLSGESNPSSSGSSSSNRSWSSSLECSEAKQLCIVFPAKTEALGTVKVFLDRLVGD